MKILHINKFFDLRGGAEIYLHRIMKEQAAAGHEVHVLSSRASSNLPSPDAGYFIHRYDFSRSEGPKKDVQKAMAYLWNTEARRATQRIIAQIKPDVIHLHNIYHHLSSSILGVIRESGIPCVQTLHDLKLACPNYKMRTEGSICERCKGGKYWNPIVHHCVGASFFPNALAAIEMTFTKATQQYERTIKTFICPSQFHADKMREWGEPASKFTVIRNPADVAPRAAPGGGGFILFAGRLSPEKGVETLIRASARVPQLPVRIAGTGPDEERLRHIANTLNARHVTFLGFVQPTELAMLRATAEAVVVPSVWYENSPLSALEAMGEGVPVLGSDIGGLPELVEDGVNGLLAKPEDVEAWVALLNRFQAIPSAARRGMGEKGRERIRLHHGMKEHLEKLEKIYAA
jgi:glycosyltransferase involved in cell wall biosynthesis